MIAKYLESLGIAAQTKAGIPGVVGFLKGGKQGSVVALRSDTDALPGLERTAVLFASKVKRSMTGKKLQKFYLECLLKYF
jgi:metal-dependent amidase/aminoacylase/carboxypeptidase family protein